MTANMTLFLLEQKVSVELQLDESWTGAVSRLVCMGIVVIVHTSG